MNNFDQLQKGDVLLSFHKDDLVSEAIARLTHSPWSHAILYIGDGKIYESIGSGTQEGKLSKYNSKRYIVGAFRIKDLTPAQADEFVACAKKRLGKRYGFFQVGYLWLLYLFGKVDDKFWQRDVDAGEDCVETIARAAASADIKLFDTNPSMLIPNDYATSDKFVRIF